MTVLILLTSVGLPRSGGQECSRSCRQKIDRGLRVGEFAGVGNSPFSAKLPLGTAYQGRGRCSFLVWAPNAAKVEAHLTTPHERFVPLKETGNGYHGAVVERVEPGATYFYRLNGALERPDPASRFQPNGVHGASEIIDPGFDWKDKGWFGLPLRDYILYEMHVGTFTPEGTFESVLPHLRSLKELGITAIELMPVAQFPGARNWGYDGVCPFAVQDSYGGPHGLKVLVDACHQAGLAVVLDVVYNHLGPEGNYLNDFGPYFTECYRTAWGRALNFDGEQSDEVRRFFLENALYWQTEFHIDALRLDAVHAVRDFSAVPFLQELARATHRQAEKLNRRFYLIAESDLNNPRLISPEALGGYGLDAQWSDDFHHCLHVLLTGERSGYYADFRGTKLFAKVFREGYAYTGQYSKFRKRRHGNSPRLNSAKQFVVFSQNHDQIGNRLLGERMSHLATLEGLKLAAGTVLLSPFIPLLFMGEEYGEPAPFQYMISHTDPELVEAVRQGRREEFAGFAWQGEAPDPSALATFEKCVLNWELCRTGKMHRLLHEFYRELIRLRKAIPAIAQTDKDSLEVQPFEAEQALVLQYSTEADRACLVLSFAENPVSVEFELPPGTWQKLLDSADEGWGGKGSAVPERLAAGAGRVCVEQNPKSLILLQQLQER